ncbi:MAG: hypothetical protein K6B12_00015 [Clostridiales bacterium]|nr:hypothetical protein [Clostridiales bacterium]
MADTMPAMTKHSEKVFSVMLYKGYPEGFAKVIAREMHTPYTADRMIAYLGRAGRPPAEEVADEMLAILADRDKFVDKHINAYAQEVINEMYRLRREEPEE